MVSIEKLAAMFARDRESARDEISRFKVAFEKDAAHALSWGTSVFEAAANERVNTQLIEYINNEVGLIEKVLIDNMIDLVTSKVLYGAKYPPQSTSPTSNLIVQYELAAWARVLAKLNNYKSFPDTTP